MNRAQFWTEQGGDPQDRPDPDDDDDDNSYDGADSFNHHLATSAGHPNGGGDLFACLDFECEPQEHQIH